MNLFSQNKKMSKSSDSKVLVYNFGIPAFQSKTGLRTCPNAGKCAAGCYARMGAYVWSNVSQAYEARLTASQTDTFIDQVETELQKLYIKAYKLDKQLVIRIHDSGDFYSMEYFQKWNEIAGRNPFIKFYAYTKQVEMLQGRHSFISLIFSLGGKQDGMIQVETARHSKVFESINQLKTEGYADASQDDMVAAFGMSNKVGLVYHGNKSYKNTKWSET